VIFNKHEEKMRLWFEEHAGRRSAQWWLSAIAFTESSFFPIPPDPFLAIALLVEKNSWWKTSLNVAFSSVLGAIFGYFIGFVFFESLGQKIINFYGLHEEFVHISELFKENVFWTMFTAAFTPIPFKLFTLTAGVAKVNLIAFIIASVIGRGLRFLFVGIIMKTFGRKIGSAFFKYFNVITSVIVLTIVLYIAFNFLF
jgi:membrane protein YqaA with SNARE-associated domain